MCARRWAFASRVTYHALDLVVPDAGLPALAYYAIALALIRLALVYIALRGSTPRERPAILRALAPLFRGRRRPRGGRHK